MIYFFPIYSTPSFMLQATSYKLSLPDSQNGRGGTVRHFLVYLKTNKHVSNLSVQQISPFLSCRNTECLGKLELTEQHIPEFQEYCAPRNARYFQNKCFCALISLGNTAVSSIQATEGKEEIELEMCKEQLTFCHLAS